MGWSLAFLRASSNFRLRTSSFLLSASQESRNLSSRWRAWSARMRALSVMSRSGAVLGGASCESTTESCVSTVSFEWQHGQVTSIGGAAFFAIPVFYARLACLAPALAFRPATLENSLMAHEF